jgi:chromosome segregation ATPase
MVRQWLQAGLCVMAAAAIGCTDNSRDSLITNTNNQVSQIATSYDYIKTKVEDYTKKMEGTNKDEAGAKSDLDAAVAEAKKLKDVAKQMQTLSTYAGAVTGVTDEEKKAMRDRFQGKIDTVRAEVVKAHGEMKSALKQANEKYEDALRPLTQALSEAQGEFAAIVRRR